MKRNATLLLLELVIMLLVFALAAAFSVQVFFRADRLGRQSAAEDAALFQAQNVAEVLKAHGGDFASAAERYGGEWEDSWTISYDAEWQATDAAATYRLEAVPIESDTPLLGKAVITVLDQNNATLTRLTVCWQEVAS